LSPPASEARPLPFFVIVHNPVCRELLESFVRIELPGFDLFADLVF